MSISQYVPGLENVIAANTKISSIDIERHKILIRGYDLIELAREASFEEVAYLMLYGELPTSDVLTQFSNRLARERNVPDAIHEIMQKLPSNTESMDALKIGIAALAPFDPELEDGSYEANQRKAERLLAKSPTLVANGWRTIMGKPRIQPSAELGFAADFLRMLTGKIPPQKDTRFFEQTLVLYVEHELAASTFAARVVSSTLSDIYGATEAGVAALKGPLHGRANEKAMEMLLEIGSLENVEPYLRALLARKQRVMGFGHRIYRRGIDPRAEMVKQMLMELAEDRGQLGLYKMADYAQTFMANEKQLYPNVDFFIGPVYYLLGIPIELDTAIFAASRIAGWAAHVIEQQNDNRIYRPRAIYSGPREQQYIPMQQRAGQTT